MNAARFVICDVFDGIASLGDGSVDLVITSPPFLALRSYLPADHVDKAKEIGSEPTPEAFIDTLLDVVEALAPKLAPHGSMCIELGDTYSGSGGAGGDYGEGGIREGQGKFDGSNHRRGLIVDHDSGRRNPGPGWPEAKSLCLIPESFRWALVYGRNPFNGRETPRWRARNVIRWCRPNPPVGALGDKFRPGTSEMVVLCKSARRYFDLDAVRTEHAEHTQRYLDGKPHTPEAPQGHNGTRTNDGQTEYYSNGNPAGAPPLDWWEIPTEPYKGSHYATFPRKLLDRPILAMSPQRVCRTCGEPSRRITERSEDYARARAAIGDFNQRDTGQGSSGSRSVLSDAAGRDLTCAENVTIGWSDCGHDNWRRGLVCDPFGGSGTTGEVAVAHGRDCVMFDLDARNADLARDRMGLFLEVVELAFVDPAGEEEGGGA